MTHLYATLHTLGITLAGHAAAARRQGRDRGAGTIEVVFWAAGLLALAGIVYAAINAYINSKIGAIR